MKQITFLSLFGCLIFLGLICVAGCKQTEVKEPISNHFNSNKIQAVLQADKNEVRAGEPITFLFSILNGKNRSICFDGRMAYPGNLTLYIKLPDSRVVIASTIAVRMTIPTKNDIVHLEPNRLYGTRITISPQSSIAVKELKHAVPGVYTF